MDVVLTQGSIWGTLPSDDVFWWQSRPDPKTENWSSFRITLQAKSPHLCQATEACDPNGEKNGHGVLVTDVDKDGDLDVMITSDHVAGCPYKYDPGGTVSLVWWENRHPRRARE